MDPIRVQIAVAGVLVAEAVVDGSEEAYRLWQAWAGRRYARDLRAGGAVLQLAELPRAWDVAVGAVIPPDSSEAEAVEAILSDPGAWH